MLSHSFGVIESALFGCLFLDFFFPEHFASLDDNQRLCSCTSSDADPRDPSSGHKVGRKVKYAFTSSENVTGMWKEKKKGDNK